MFLNTHLWVFFGMYCFLLPLRLFFAGIIYSSMEWKCSSSILKQLFLMSSSSGLTWIVYRLHFWDCPWLYCQWPDEISVIFHISSKSLQYVHNRIMETNTSCIEASLLLPLSSAHQKRFRFLFYLFQLIYKFPE